MLSVQRIIGIIIVLALSMPVFCQKIDKIDRSKQRTEKPKNVNATRGAAAGSTKQPIKAPTQTSQKRKQSQTAQSKSQTKSPSSTIQQPTNRKEKPSLTISSNKAYFTPEGGSISFIVQSNNSWNVTDRLHDWARLERNGNRLILNVDHNQSDKPRTDYFVISSAGLEQRVDISQSGDPNWAPYLTASSTSLSFSSYGGKETIYISSNREWKVKYGLDSWGHLERDGNSLNITIDENKTLHKRSDFFVLIADGVEIRVDITQPAMVSSYTSTNTSSLSSDYGSNYNRSYARRRWWKRNFSVGIEADVETNVNSKSGADMFYSAGLLFRLGNCQQVFSVVTGVKYRWFRVMPDYGNYHDTGVKWNLLGGSVVVPLYLRFNFARMSSRCKLFLGLGGDFGAKVFPVDGANDVMSNYYYDLSPQLGFILRHFEMAIYWKMYPESPFRSYPFEHSSEYKCNSIMGMSMSIYF